MSNNWRKLSHWHVEKEKGQNQEDRGWVEEERERTSRKGRDAHNSQASGSKLNTIATETQRLPAELGHSLGSAKICSLSGLDASSTGSALL